MKILSIALLLLLAPSAASSHEKTDTLLTVFWNLENFFDTTDGGTGESDTEFSPAGSRHWTAGRFRAKCDAVAKSLMWLGDRYGRMPDLVGLAEVENRVVLRRLLSSTLLRKYGYGIVHYDSGDRRGIDVAILYRQSQMSLQSSSLKTPGLEGESMATRDILQAEMRLRSGLSMHFCVNHHPSKFGGDEASAGRREAAMTALKELCDSLAAVTPDVPVVAMGDFNDTPDSSPFSIIDTVLVNKAGPLHEKGEGTIRYEGKWDLIDMFLVSPRLDSCTRMEISRIPFLMKWERKHPGWKPFRTYSGPRYIGGVSDHCPVVLTILLTD